MPTTPLSFVQAMKHFFGLRPDQTLTGFAAELKALDHADRAYFKIGLGLAGYTLAD